MTLRHKTVLIGIVMTLFGLFLLISLISLVVKQDQLKRVTQEPVGWLAAEAELERLVSMISAVPEITDGNMRARAQYRQNLRIHADILWARLNALQTEEIARKREVLILEIDWITNLKVQVAAFEATLQDPDFGLLANDWHERLNGYSDRIRHFAIQSNHGSLQLYDQTKNVTTRLYGVMAIAVLGILACGGGLIWLQAHTAEAAKKAQTEMKIANARLADAIEVLPSGFVLYDEVDHFVFSNQLYREFYPDIERDMKPGTSLNELTRLAARRGLIINNKSDVNNWASGRLRLRRVTGSGIEEKLNDGRWILAIDRRSKHGWTVGIRTDITQLKEQERRLASALSQAESASRSKSSFLAIMSHEIRTPMNGVLGTLELLGGTELNKQQRQYLEVSEKSARDLLVLLDDILDISKMEAGRMELEDVPFDLRILISGVADIFRAKARQKGVDLSVIMPPSVDHKLRGDPGRLRQILLNLVGNAVKFTEHGFISIHVFDYAPSTEKQQYLKFQIQDTGIGIPSDSVSGLFKEFTQLDGSYSRLYGGTGLGLAICRNLVELMEGRLGVESIKGEGSLFWIELCFKHVESDSLDDLKIVQQNDDDFFRKASSTSLIKTNTNTNSVDSVAAINSATMEVSSVRLLVVDDSEVNRMVARDLLVRAGFHVTVAVDGFDGVYRTQTEKFDAVLMDISMPRLDGIEATKLIRAPNNANSTIPIIAMTAYTGAEHRQNFVEAGMTGFLAKPLNGSDLLSVVKQAVSLNRTRADGQEVEKSLTLASSSQNDRPEMESNIDHMRSDSRDPPESITLPELDRSAIDQLVLDLGSDRVPDLLITFINEINRRLPIIERAVLHCDLEEIAFQTHPLKSMAGSFGCLQLQNVAVEMEKSCAFGDMAILAAQLETLSRIIERTQEKLTRHFNLPFPTSQIQTPEPIIDEKMSTEMEIVEL